MNRITVEMQRTKGIRVEHPVILIDGIPLDLYIHNLYPDNLFLGLIPTITDWLWLKEEAELILSLYYSDQNKVILPILMCPDDLDLSCTIIVAEVIKSDIEVVWNRIGVNKSQLGTPIGTEVVWLELVPEMKFNSNFYFENFKIIYKPI